MPLSHRIARWNKVGLNRVTRRFAGRAPMFGIVEHIGRKSGAVYQTPINVFRGDRQFVVALTYGPDAQWVRNVVAAGRCRLQTGGRWYDLDEPRLVHDPTRRHMPWLVRRILGLTRVEEFLYLRQADGDMG